MPSAKHVYCLLPGISLLLVFRFLAIISPCSYQAGRYYFDPLSACNTGTLALALYHYFIFFVFMAGVFVYAALARLSNKVFRQLALFFIIVLAVAILFFRSWLDWPFWPYY